MAKASKENQRRIDMLFKYEAYNKMGQTIRETIDAESEEIVAGILRDMGLQAMSIKLASEKSKTVLPDPPKSTPLFSTEKKEIIPPSEPAAEPPIDHRKAWQTDFDNSLALIEEMKEYIKKKYKMDNPNGMIEVSDILEEEATRHAFRVAKGEK